MSAQTAVTMDSGPGSVGLLNRVYMVYVCMVYVHVHVHVCVLCVLADVYICI